MRIPDPQLNYHADRFIAQRISAHGITFERYLTDPAHYDTLALQPEPLLPAQRTVAEVWARQTPIACGPTDTCAHCADGRQCPHCCDD
jgi:hypothetical protein